MTATADGHHMVPVQCQDDPFGFKAVVVCGDVSYPLCRCIPFLSNHEGESVENNHGRFPSGRNVWNNTVNNNNRASTGQMDDEPTNTNHRQPDGTRRPVQPETGDSTNTTFPDGRSPGGSGQVRSMEHDNFPEDDEKNKGPKKKKKLTKKKSKKSRRIDY